MSLKKNIAANYASQIYVTLAGIVVLPLYIKYMGAEAYGLVGFFAMLQAWFNLLDIGLTPTMARESARYRGGALSVMDYRRLARALEGIFAAVALGGGLLLYASAPSIADRWLNENQLTPQEITEALQLMAIIIGCRWMCGLYRGVITGAERLVWLSGFNSLVATGRFLLVLPVLIFISATPKAFFSFQLGMALIELGGLTWMAYRLLPGVPVNQRIQWQWAPLRPVLKFSLSIAFTSSVWVLVTQTDKLILSKVLPLADYGYFTIVVLVASGVMIISGPISSALMPRLTRLHAEGRDGELISTYRQATQVAAVVGIPAATALAYYAPEVLWLWTADQELVRRVSEVLTLYAAGYGILVVSAFPYYLQYAKGNLTLHLIGNLIFALILIPTIIWAARSYGMVGAGWVWLLSNLAIFIFWQPIVHRRFARGLHLGWLLKDIAIPSILSFTVASIAHHFYVWSSTRLILTLEITAVSTAMVLAAFLGANRLRLSSLNVGPIKPKCKI